MGRGAGRGNDGRADWAEMRKGKRQKSKGKRQKCPTPPHHRIARLLPFAFCLLPFDLDRHLPDLPAPRRTPAPPLDRGSDPRPRPCSPAAPPVRPRAIDQRDGVGVDLEAGVGRGDVVGDDEVESLLAQLARGVRHDVRRSRRRSRPRARRPARPRSAPRMSTVRVELELHRAVGLLELLRRASWPAGSRRPPPPSAASSTLANSRSTASCISAAVCTRTQRTPCGVGSAVGPLTSTTSAPRRHAAAASA